MLSRVCSAAVNGIDAYPVEVEVNVGYGDTLVVIVGLPDAAVKESRDRVSTALTNSGYKFPMGKTTINLAPADVKKEGPSFDLPIARRNARRQRTNRDRPARSICHRRRTRPDRRRAPGAKAFCPSPSRAKAEWQNRHAGAGGKRGRSCGRRRPASHPRSKSPRSRAISRRRNQNLAAEGGHRQNCSTSRHDDELDFAEVKGQENRETRVGNRGGRRT